MIQFNHFVTPAGIISVNVTRLPSHLTSQGTIIIFWELELQLVGIRRPAVLQTTEASDALADAVCSSVPPPVENATRPAQWISTANPESPYTQTDYTATETFSNSDFAATTKVRHGKFVY